MDIKNITFFNFGKIESAGQAVKILKDIGIAFYVVGIIMILIPLYLNNLPATLGGVVFLIIGFMLHKHQSRTGSIIAVIQQLIAVCLIALLIYPNNLQVWGVWRDFIISLIILVYSVRATQASFAYHKFTQSTVHWKNFAIKTLCAVIYAVILAAICFFGLAKFAPNFMQSNMQMPGFIINLAVLVGLFLSYNGFLPFTKNRPICEVHA
ncbi:MAG: hypothetical protein JSS53_04520 [Proteobacteria bacterium]|nr:hypothetical protein [Pseudomonadota bacterium]